VVFSRAANIIRESIDIDGVVFFDASVGSFNSLSQQFTGSDTSEFTSSEEDSACSDERGDSSSSAQNTPHVIAFSTPQASSIDGEVYPPNRRRMSLKALSALLRRYPKGTIFDFDENGKPQPDDYSDESTPSIVRTTSSHPGLIKRRTLSFIGNLGSEVSKCFPGARSVAFVPVWDHIRKRWRAGCFAYTLAKTRFFTNQGDISYLRAFATLAMAEIASLETHLASQAQSDVLGSLSHELRSPLHGIILGVEFLTDTPLSVFQGNLLHILETCGRTLSDTIDHLLYYAKVNNFIPSGKTPDSRARGLRKEMNCTLQAGMKNITTPVRVDVLVEEVTESIFAGFNFQRLSIGQLERDHRKSHADVHAIRRNDNLQAKEDLGPWRERDGELSTPSKYVVIDLAIDPGCSHYYHAISGAIRRIVMNLFGNALKYTTSGSIRVALSQECIRRKRPRSNDLCWAKIVVTDTGKGISEDFLVNHLFQEFRQEDSIGPGLGLGLSVVKKIVSSLKGKVSIESQVGFGTTATVLLPLQPMPKSPCLTEPPEPELKDYAEQRRELKGLRICFVGFGAPLGLPSSRGDSGHRSHTDDYQSIWNVCQKDLAMEVVTTAQAVDLVPDIVLCEEAALHSSFVTKGELSRTPLVVVCANALSAYRLSVDSRFQDRSPITEFISQP
jgi:signal transduction histidine kinase